MTISTTRLVGLSLIRQKSDEINLPIPSKVCRSSSSQARLVDDKHYPTCSICYDLCFVQVKDICSKKCSNNAYCLSCIRKFWKSWLEDSRYFISPPRCINCSQPVNFAMWKSVMGAACYAKYESNIDAQFIMKCPCCHSNCSFFLEKDFKCDQLAFENFLSARFSEQPDGIEAKFRFLLDQYLSYEIAASTLITFLNENFGNTRAIDMLLPDILIGHDHDKSSTYQMKLPYLIDSMERRANLLLVGLRLPYADLFTPCCSANVCFRCKFETSHANETCEQVMESMVRNNAAYEGIFACPNCNVLTVLAGGCLDITCVCGYEYQLNECLWM